MDAHDTELKKELDATLHARRELGEEYESALVDSFLEKVDQRVDAVVDRRVRRQLAEQQMAQARGARSTPASDSWAERFGFGIISLVLAIPLSAIAVTQAGLSGLVVAWAGIVGVNLVQAARSNAALFGRRRAERDSDWQE
ncbi:hypothetical protein [Streptomyces sp. NPDC014006]|uniref:hypothetical protein n=1 Tax=Streptomyces sp. NPDC014006 TaxID=3364870 RepID=UPI00370200B8